MRKRILPILLLFLPLLAAITVPAQNPCMQGWQYSRPISILNHESIQLNDWQVRVTIDTQTLIDQGKMNADGSDIRFTLADCCTEIPYWIQSGLNTPSTELIVRVPQLYSSDTTWIQMYYGNPSANVPVSDIDSVLFSIGNDSMGTDTATPSITVATKRYAFPINATTVRWRIYAADTMQIEFIVSNNADMVTGSTQPFDVPASMGFHSFDEEIAATAGGHPGWYTSSGGHFLNTCAPSTPCPGSCGDVVHGPLGQQGSGSLTMDSCGVYPSMRIWYRRGASTDPSSFVWNEFDRLKTFPITPSGSSVICVSGSLPLSVPNIQALGYQWYRNGLPVPGATGTQFTAIGDGLYYCVADFGYFCQSVSSDSFTVSYSSKKVDLGPDRVFCTDGSDVIHAGAGYSSYSWNDGSSNEYLVVTGTGSYSVTVTDTLSCVDSDNVYLTVKAPPVALIGILGKDSLCKGDTTTISRIGSSFPAYEWIPGGETSASIQVTDSGKFSLIVWDSDFCSDTSDVVVVSMHPEPTVSLGSDLALCQGDSAVISPGGGWAAIRWPDNSTGMTFQIFTPGSYVVTVADSQGCIARDTVNVAVNPNPSINLGPDDSLCSSATLTLDGGLGYAAYEWSTGDTTQTVNVGPGMYSVAVVDSNGCNGVSNQVNLYAYPEIDSVTISIVANGLSATSSQNYQWYKDSLPIPDATGAIYLPTATGTYMVQASDANGCSEFFSNSIYVETIDMDAIPQGFSPNGDGVNDRFEVKNISFFQESSLLVINRYGVKVYEKAPYDNTFAGISSSGAELPDGTYFYILNLGNGKEFSDYLIINR
ncbi:MAG: hypothetical protein RLZZ165_1909 [Bacteroidota bacterium]